jgi:predicted CoA-substrate-specific enzyme activase
VIHAGIDAGSRTTKIALMGDGDEVLLASAVGEPGACMSGQAEELFERIIAQHQVDRNHIGRVVATGYGRAALRMADTTITEITCHARGVRFLMPDAVTVVEIGGQDSKIILLDRSGGVRDFVMNDRCAAGTGRFLEMVAERLGVGVVELGELAAASRRPAIINPTCAVFAESEIIGLLSAGARPEDIAAGVQETVATRMATLAADRAERPVVFAGGVALIPGMASALSRALTCEVTVASAPQLTGAIGAALMACREE